MGFATAALLLALVSAPQQNVTGKWDGTITFTRGDGSTGTEPALLILEQKDNTIAGTVGGNESDRHPITSGTIEGSKITLVARNARNDREFRFELTVEDGELKGTMMSGNNKATLTAKKRKE